MIDPSPISWPSPNVDARARPIDLIVLHYTGMARLEDALARLCDPAPLAGAYPGPWQAQDQDPNAALGRVSAHYVVARDGRIFALADEEQRAWHAGQSFWRGLQGVNDNSIGIEIENGGHDFGLPPYPDVQIEALCALLTDIMTRRALRPHQVVGHACVAPGRKADPGEHFPWRSLAARGLALWPARAPEPVPPPPLDGARLLPAEIGILQEILAAIGYGVDVTQAFDPATAAAIEAFQRRFRTARIDGRPDTETSALMMDIANQTLKLSLPRQTS